MLPLIRQWPSTRSARVRMLAMSLPASGSVMPSAAIFSPLIAGTSYRCFCSSVPHLRIGGVAISVCTLIAMPTPPDPQRAISSARTMALK